VIDRFLANLRQPRHGVVVLTSVVSLLMAAHWTPMMFPGLLVLVLTVVRPGLAVRPVTWWLMAALWFAAVVVQQDRMEDHVWLFTCWLVALAVSLAAGVEGFLDHAAWHARVLVGVTFSVAVLWKLFFHQFVNGMALWTFLVTDGRFAPLARGLGIPHSALHEGQEQLTAVLAGTTDAYQPPSDLLWRVTVIAVLTLLLEASVAVSFLSPDGSPPARLRLPSIVTFGLVTYSLVPVLGFAALLATLAMVASRWRRSVAWVFPVMVVAALVRVMTLNL
jgi:hypothetical protein